MSWTLRTATKWVSLACPWAPLLDTPARVNAPPRDEVQVLPPRGARSISATSNRSLGRWGERLGDAMVAAALIDRLVATGP